MFVNLIIILARIIFGLLCLSPLVLLVLLVIYAPVALIGIGISLVASLLIALVMFLPPSEIVDAHQIVIFRQCVAPRACIYGRPHLCSINVKFGDQLDDLYFDSTRTGIINAGAPRRRQCTPLLIK